MARKPSAVAVYQVADLFRERCLAGDTSLLWHHRVVWTPDNLDALGDAFTAPDVGSGSFLAKLRTRIGELSPDVHRIAADLLAFYYLFPDTIRPQTRMANIQQVIGWKIGDEEDRPDLDLLRGAFASGIGNDHIFYHIGPLKLLMFYLQFVRRLKDDRTDPLDPDACNRLAGAVSEEVDVADSARHILLHLLFPDRFERIPQTDQKRRIVAAFHELADGAVDLDDALFNIRGNLGKTLGRPDFDFYDPDVHQRWDHQDRPVKRRYWKIAPGEDATRWKEFIEKEWIAIWWRDSPDLRSLDVSSEQDLRARLEAHPVMREHAFRFDMAASQLWAFYNQMTPGDLVCAYGGGRFLGWGEIRGDYRFDVDDLGYPHRRAVEWRSTEPLDASTVSPDLRKKVQQNTTIVELTESDFSEITGRGAGVPVLPAPPTLNDLAAVTHLDLDVLEEIESLLLEKKQIVFEGPPGSGKTFVARLFARYFTGNPLDPVGPPDERIELVQFHQSYGYEDFVQGIRPVTDDDGHLQYKVLPGIFMRMCDLAATNPDKRFVLIIDEINRGNLSRIFGELLLLLEYRNERVRLPYGAGDGSSDHAYLSIPENLYLIGTMNSTDRSLALIDYALRRRFYFYRFAPVVGGQALVLGRWLAGQEMGDDERQVVLRLFVGLNERVQHHLTGDYQIGHSYFMTPAIGTVEGRERVWRRAVRPLLAEYFQHHRDREATLDEFEPKRLLSGPDGPGDTAPDLPGDMAPDDR